MIVTICATLQLAIGSASSARELLLLASRIDCTITLVEVIFPKLAQSYGVMYKSPYQRCGFMRRNARTEFMLASVKIEQIVKALVYLCFFF